METSYKLFKTYEFLHKANLDLIKLKNEEIEVYMTDSNTVHLAPYYAQAVGGIKIFVAESDFERAQDILSKDHIEDENLKEIFRDEKFVPAMRCPNCDSPDIFQERSILSGLFFLIAFLLPVSIAKNKFRCAKCNHRWKLNPRKN